VFRPCGCYCCCNREGPVGKQPKTTQFDRVLLFLLGAIVLVFGLKYFKQYFSLLLTLLTLKFVWVVLLLLAVLTLLKKKT
jgi:Ca2+/Na+ antiporter